MRKVLYITLTILAAVLVFLVILFLFAQNKGKGALQVTSTPNSKVYLNDKLIGTTPLCKCDLKDMIVQGEYIIKLIPTSGNYDSFSQKIIISPKVLTVVDNSFADKGLGNASVISLTQIDNKKTAQISVVTFPSNSQVFLDSNLSGQSPLSLNNITESDHEIKIVRKGYKEKIVRIRTVEGYRLDTLIYLGIDPSSIASSSGLIVPIISTPSSLLNILKVKILSTPTGFLRVRQEPSIAASEISQVKPGETYELIDEKTGWFEIKLTSGNFGWISSQYASKVN